MKQSGQNIKINSKEYLDKKLMEKEYRKVKANSFRGYSDYQNMKNESSLFNNWRYDPKAKVIAQKYFYNEIKDRCNHNYNRSQSPIKNEEMSAFKNSTNYQTKIMQKTQNRSTLISPTTSRSKLVTIYKSREPSVNQDRENSIMEETGVFEVDGTGFENINNNCYEKSHKISLDQKYNGNGNQFWFYNKKLCPGNNDLRLGNFGKKDKYGPLTPKINMLMPKRDDYQKFISKTPQKLITTENQFSHGSMPNLVNTNDRKLEEYTLEKFMEKRNLIGNCIKHSGRHGVPISINRNAKIKSEITEEDSEQNESKMHFTNKKSQIDQQNQGSILGIVDPIETDAESETSGYKNKDNGISDCPSIKDLSNQFVRDSTCDEKALEITKTENDHFKDDLHEFSGNHYQRKSCIRTKSKQVIPIRKKPKCVISKRRETKNSNDNDFLDVSDMDDCDSKKFDKNGKFMKSINQLDQPDQALDKIMDFLKNDESLVYGTINKQPKNYKNHYKQKFIYKQMQYFSKENIKKNVENLINTHMVINPRSRNTNNSTNQTQPIATSSNTFSTTKIFESFAKQIAENTKASLTAKRAQNPMSKNQNLSYDIESNNLSPMLPYCHAIKLKAKQFVAGGHVIHQRNKSLKRSDRLDSSKDQEKENMRMKHNRANSYYTRLAKMDQSNPDQWNQQQKSQFYNN